MTSNVLPSTSGARVSLGLNTANSRFNATSRAGTLPPTSSARRQSVVIIDSDENNLAAMGDLLKGQGRFEVTCRIPERLDSVMRIVISDRPDLILMGNRLIGTLRGIHVLSALRTQGYSSPVIFMSTECDPQTRAEALDMTADEFLCLPCSHAEILARVRAVMRRAARSDDSRLLGTERVGDCDFMVAGCTISPSRLMAFGTAGREAAMSARQVAILMKLRRCGGSVVTRSEMVHDLWGCEISPKTRSLDQAIYELKQVLREIGGDGSAIVNVKGVGYRLTCGESQVAA